ncbi:fimbrillin family protein [Elizabethkingia meningoseptica]
MMNYFKQYINPILFSIALVSGLQLLTNCSANDEAYTDIGTTSEARIVINVAGINDAEPQNATAGIKGKMTSVDGAAKIVGKNEVDFGNQMTGIVSMKQEASYSPVSAVASSSTKAALSGARALTVPMTPGYKFRFVVYEKKADASFVYVSHLDYNAGDVSAPAAIDVSKGSTYKWVAYSYNNSNTMPVFDPNSGIQSSAIEDLLYDSEEVTIPTGAGQKDVKADITFNHMLARVKLELRSLIGTISDNPKTHFQQQLFKQGVLDLKTGNINNITTATTPNPLSLTASEAGSVYSAYFYTVGGQNITNLGILMDDVTVANKPLPNGSAVIFAPVTPVAGRSYTAKVEFAPKGGIIGNRQWARGNLFYENGLYQIRTDDTTRRPLGNFRSTDFWRWGSTLPNTGAASDNAYVDACTKVLPANTWRTPVQADFEALMKVPRERVGGGDGYTRYKDDKGGWITFKYDGRTGFADTSGESNYWIQNQSVFEVSGLDGTGNEIYDFFPKSVLINIRCIRDIN